MTELIWDGKYDADGRKTAPTRTALPFQTVETVNESAESRKATLDLFAKGRPTDWRNRLVWGDTRYVLPALLPEFAGKVDLIYIDPPFDTGADFSFSTTVPEDGDAFTKQPSVIEQKAYRDTWGRGLDSYLQWFYQTALILRELLAENGSIYVHLDWHVGHYAKAILDEVFGYDNLRGEIVWKRTSARSDAATLNHIHDVIYFYVKGDALTWNPQFTEHSDDYATGKYNQVDEDGRRFRLDNMTSPNPRPNMMYEWKGFASPAKGWRYSRETMAALDAEGRIWYPDDKTKRLQLIRYLDESRGRPLTSVWTDIFPVNSQAEERVAYRTQKPEALLDRILRASSNPGDLVLDCFAGSGTTAAVAEKLGRRWITSDLGRFSVHTVRKRLLAQAGVRPFVVQNLGKYERQAWQGAHFGGAEAAREHEAAVQTAYRHFLLRLYGAEPLANGAWLHGAKAGRLVHVGSVDGPVTPSDVAQMAAEFKRLQGTEAGAPAGIDVLGWDFAFELHEEARHQAQAAGLDLRFLKIPREVMERKAVDAGDVRFYELGALGVEAAVDGRTITVRLTDFAIPQDDIPEDVRRSVTHWRQWIDYWAVDWDYRDDTFHNQWQATRTKAAPSLALETTATVETPGRRTVVVKVIDLLGNDTTRSVTVDVL